MDKKTKAEKRYILDQIGQESEKKAIPLVQEVMKEGEKQDIEEEAFDKEQLKSGRKKIVTYNRLLAGLLHKRLALVDWPQGWTYKVVPTEIGVIMEMRSPEKRFFRAGFKPTGEEKYDLNAIEVYALRAENTIDRLTGADQAQKSPAGEIWTP